MIYIIYAETVAGFPPTDHSFFGTEWQKRWCALSHHTFYYYGSEKGTSASSTFSSQLWVTCCLRIFQRTDIWLSALTLFPGFWQWHCSCCVWAIKDDVLISCNQTSSRRGSSVSMGTLSKWTTPYGKTRRKTAALKFRLQTSESIRYARLTVRIWVIALLNVRPKLKNKCGL